MKFVLQKWEITTEGLRMGRELKLKGLQKDLKVDFKDQKLLSGIFKIDKIDNWVLADILFRL